MQPRKRTLRPGSKEGRLVRRVRVAGMGDVVMFFVGDGFVGGLGWAGWGALRVEVEGY